MTDAGQRNAAKQFAMDWKGKGYEKGESQPFWISLLRGKEYYRLQFCLYAEEAGIFGGHAKFHNYIKMIADRNIGDVRRGVIDLFRVLDTKPEDRDPYMDDELASFPYVNGGLFAEENIVIPRFTEEIVSLLLHNASEELDWSDISPTISSIP